jgi:hypothetical protein
MSAMVILTIVLARSEIDGGIGILLSLGTQ